MTQATPFNKLLPFLQLIRATPTTTPMTYSGMPGVEIQHSTGGEHESESGAEVELPPYSNTDDLTKGLRCYVRGCSSVAFGWKSTMKYLPNCHPTSQAQLKEMYSYQKKIPDERREDDRPRYHQKIGTPCPPKKAKPEQTSDEAPHVSGAEASTAPQDAWTAIFNEHMVDRELEVEHSHKKRVGKRLGQLWMNRRSWCSEVSGTSSGHTSSMSHTARNPGSRGGQDTITILPEALPRQKHQSDEPIQSSKKKQADGAEGLHPKRCPKAAPSTRRNFAGTSPRAGRTNRALWESQPKASNISIG